MNKLDNTLSLKWSKKIKAINDLGGSCLLCGEKNIFKLCFHHKNKEDKLKCLNFMYHDRWTDIQEELIKCQLLCHNCHNELHFKEREIGAKNKKRTNNKKIILEVKGIFECEKCGYKKHFGNLHFHHPKEKKFEISGGINIKLKTIHDLTDVMIEEINICTLLCSNCHAESHINMEKFNQLKDIIYKKIETHKEKPNLDVELIVNLRKQGFSYSQIMEKVNCCKSSLNYVLKKYNLNGHVNKFKDNNRTVV